MKANKRVRDLARRVRQVFVKPVAAQSATPTTIVISKPVTKTAGEELQDLFNLYKKKEKT